MAIYWLIQDHALDCFATLAMTLEKCYPYMSSRGAAGNVVIYWPISNAMQQIATGLKPLAMTYNVWDLYFIDCFFIEYFHLYFTRSCILDMVCYTNRQGKVYLCLLCIGN